MQPFYAFILWIDMMPLLNALFLFRRFESRGTTPAALAQVNIRDGADSLANESQSRQYAVAIASPTKLRARKRPFRKANFTPPNSASSEIWREHSTLPSFKDQLASSVDVPEQLLEYPISDKILGTEESRSADLNQIVPVADMKSKVATDIFETVFSELYRGLTDMIVSPNLPVQPSPLSMQTLIGEMSSPAALKTVLVDFSMCALSLLQNYHRFKDSQHWHCDETSCALDEEVNESENDEKTGTQSRPGGLATGTVVSFLVDVPPPLPEVSLLREGDAAAPLPPPEEEIRSMSKPRGGVIFVSDFNISSPVRGSARASRGAGVDRLPRPRGQKEMLQALLRYFLISLLVNTVSHEVLPAAMHLLEALAQNLLLDIMHVAV